MMTLRNYFRTSVLTLCGVLLLSSSLGLATAHAATPDTKTRGALQEAVQRNVLRVGISSFVPWAMQDKTGKYVGFEVDVATRLAKDLGLELEIVPTRWSGIVPALLTGKFDIIICGLSITPERTLKVNFTIPYDYAGIEAVGTRKAAAGRTTLADFNTPETVVAARTGSTAAAAAKQALPKATFRLFDDEAPAVQEMLNGRAHLLFASAPLGTFEVLRAPEQLVSLTKELLYPQPIGIAVRKGDFDTVNALDSWIRVVEAEGWLKARRAYWFESKDWEKTLQ